MSAGIEHLTESTFDELVGSSDKAVIVDFWAEWCGPCKMIAPILAEIADEHDNVVVAKVDVDAHPGLAQRYQVMSIPTMLVFKDGEVARRLVGAKPKGALVKELDEFL